MRSKIVTQRWPEPILAAIRHAATSHGVTMTTLVRLAVAEWLKAKGYPLSLAAVDPKQGSLDMNEEEQG